MRYPNRFCLAFSLIALWCLFMNGVVCVPAKAAPPAPFQLIVRNGAMTQGGDIPAFWNNKYGDVTLATDTAICKSKPASFRVTGMAGKSGAGFQTLTGGAGAKFKLAGWFKTSGSAKAQVMVQAFSEGYKQNQFIQILYLEGESDWKAFSKDVTLPPWTAFFNIGVLVEGEGKAWLDDVQEAGKTVDVGRPEDAWTSSPPAKDKPSVAGWGFYPEYPQAWQEVHKNFLRRTKEGKINIVFLGDSITQGWGGAGKEIWEKRYAPLGAVNYGIGGDSTRQVLWRIAHGELDGLTPKLVVLKIGTNNLYDNFNSGTDAEIADGITAIVAAVRGKLPGTKILLLGILPRQNEYFSGRITKINGLIAKLADGKTVHFLDMGTQFADAPGKVKASLFDPDQLHLATPGYQVWADTMEPLFAELSR